MLKFIILNMDPESREDHPVLQVILLFQSVWRLLNAQILNMHYYILLNAKIKMWRYDFKFNIYAMLSSIMKITFNSNYNQQNIKQKII